VIDLLCGIIGPRRQIVRRQLLVVVGRARLSNRDVDGIGVWRVDVARHSVCLSCRGACGKRSTARTAFGSPAPALVPQPSRLLGPV
jgi:hypothetical protein